jgi:hypothetical protein
VVEYNLGDTAFTDPGNWPGSSELKAVVHYPAAMPAGKAPLLMFLHGQNVACEGDGDGWPCPAGARPYPSYRGYDYLGRALAARGFVVVSLSANGVNFGVGTAPQRMKLINRHLAMWQQLATAGRGPLAGRFTDAAGKAARVDFRGHVDLTRVGTMGHSVAGEAVMMQASDKHRREWPAGVTVRAVVPMASVYFEQVEGDVTDTLVTKASFAVLGAQCWRTGERQYFDNARGRSVAPAYLAVVAAANHNYFNTVWSDPSGGFPNGDDSSCKDRPARPTQQAQQDVAVAYLTAFYERTLRGDTRYDAMLTGRAPFGVPGVSVAVEHLPGRG